MPVRHQAQTVRVPAGADLTAKEGCFVKLSSSAAVLTAATDTPADVLGVVNVGDVAGGTVDVFLPCYHGQVEVKVDSASLESVTLNTRLYLADDGTVGTAESGTLVAVAIEPGDTAGTWTCRLVEPVTVPEVTE